MLGAFKNIFKIPELRKRLLFTLGILLLLQVGNQIPIPGIDSNLLLQLSRGSGGANDIFGLINQFTGGAFQRLSIFAMGVMPYITASIVLQLLTIVIPTLEQLSKEGEEGRKKIEQWTRYLTVVITFGQSFMLLSAYQHQEVNGFSVAYNPGFSFLFQGAIAMTAGSILVMWMGEQITQQGIGNGISLIIFANIIARFPQAIALLGGLVKEDMISTFTLVFMIALMVGVIGFIVLLTYGQRRVMIKRGKMIVGRRQAPATTSYLPLRINTAGVIPVIFASSIMIFPSTILSLIGGFLPEKINMYLQDFTHWFVPGNPLYVLGEFLLILFFCYFYTAITFNPKDIAENLQKHGVAIPGYQHGARTEEYLNNILTRITLAGAIMLAFVAILPQIFIAWSQVPPQMNDFLGGTSLIIVVGVALDTVNQIENHLRVRNYDGFRVGPTRRPRF
ncbi:preprotein translocase subunit SecY [bacterium]|nr:MAG: Protein translocase subunit SecY [Candidatus Hinthialibacteria bacterium OLB16]MCK6497306.1 preprotein translocase subunit SecY [bacterium]NUP91229.1 preprotein translocase subunit SecY [Candidatus Omnitrophota bacterium]